MEWSIYLNSLNKGFHPDYPEDSKYLLPYVNHFLIKNSSMTEYLKFMKINIDNFDKFNKSTSIYDKSASISQYFRYLSPSFKSFVESSNLTKDKKNFLIENGKLGDYIKFIKPEDKFIKPEDKFIDLKNKKYLDKYYKYLNKCQDKYQDKSIDWIKLVDDSNLPGDRKEALINYCNFKVFLSSIERIENINLNIKDFKKNKLYRTELFYKFLQNCKKI